MRFTELLRFFPYRGLEIVRGSGQYVWGADGRKYLDMHTGHGVAFLGHKNPHVINALLRQLNLITTASTSFNTEALQSAIEDIGKIVPEGLDVVAFLNTGSEAVELAMKLAVRYTGRHSFTAFDHSFHGRTLGALSLTWNRRYREGFSKLLANVRFGRFNDPSGVEKVVREDTAAVFIEPVQGEGGVRPASRAFIEAIRRRAEEVGALLVVDEIQSGFGRTGNIWFHQQFEVRPDILLAGKALGGGYPVSALITGKSVANALKVGDHGSTYGGNPLALAAVSGAINALISDGVVRKAGRTGSLLKEMLDDSLRDLQEVREIRGAGLMIGIDLRVRAAGKVSCAQRRGLLALTAGPTVIRLLPPYLITQEDCEEAVKVISECIKGDSS